MKTYLTSIFFIFTLSACDYIQQARGVVLDTQTKQPIDHVIIENFEVADSTNHYSKSIHSNNKGEFDFMIIRGGLKRYPNLILYFNKQGYKTFSKSFDSVSKNDTIYLEPI